MRLQILRDGFRPLQRIPLAIIRALMGQVPGPIATMSYRRELFGLPLSQCIQEAMRGARHWRVAEVELFAARISKLNDCAY